MLHTNIPATYTAYSYIRVTYELYTDYIQITYRFNPVRLHMIHTDYIQATYELHTDYIQITYRLHMIRTDNIQATYKLRAPYRLHTNYIVHVT